MYVPLQFLFKFVTPIFNEFSCKIMLLKNILHCSLFQYIVVHNLLLTLQTLQQYSILCTLNFSSERA